VTVAVACARARGQGLARVLRRDGVRILDALGLGASELSIVIVGDAAMRRMNREFRAIDEPTDVLSFPQFEPSDTVMRMARRRIENHIAIAQANGARAQTGNEALTRRPPPLPIGDVVISVDTAGRQARDLGQRLELRARDLLIHGVLHLIGYDHERSAAAARRMFARERELAARLAADSGGGRSAAARRRA
jgi:probable rRNA maturation factor